jgi:hypothetical protein
MLTGKINLSAKDSDILLGGVGKEDVVAGIAAVSVRAGTEVVGVVVIEGVGDAGGVADSVGFGVGA